jgi:hypothetical protein
MMASIYRALLEEWARRGHPVGGPRVRLAPARKLWLALGAVPRAYGWR